MKKIFLTVLGVAALLSFHSCLPLDNYTAPGSTWEGTVTDSYTNAPILSSQNDWQMDIWERSWTKQPNGATASQQLRIKQDGTYENTKLFDGTYDLIPHGPFWPIDTIKGLELKKYLKYDFTVTPYLQVLDFKTQLYQGPQLDSKGNPTGVMLDSVKFTFRIKAPLLTSPKGVALPRLYQMRVFFSLTPFCGNGSNSSIGPSEYTAKTTMNNNFSEAKGVFIECANNNNFSWANILDSNNTTQTITLSTRVKSQYTYNVRVGASVYDTYQKMCYSPIVNIVVP